LFVLEAIERLLSALQVSLSLLCGTSELFGTRQYVHGNARQLSRKSVSRGRRHGSQVMANQVFRLESFPEKGFSWASLVLKYPLAGVFFLKRGFPSVRPLTVSYLYEHS
jgi:hypothetical protein